MSKSVEGPDLYDRPRCERYWFIEDKEEVLEAFNSSSGNGLSSSEVDGRFKTYGFNTFERKDKFRALKILFEKVNSILIYVLLVTALISLYLDHVLEFYAILIIIGFTVLLGFFQEYRAERSVEALAKLASKKVKVVRDGSKVDVDAKELVPGDIVIIESGLKIPADLRIIESNNLRINESVLTGESVPKGKHSEALRDHELSISDRENMAFSGTSVMAGSGRGVVVATGFESEIGKISKTLVDIKDQKTPLQKKVDAMSAKISYVVILVAVLAFFVLLAYDTDPGVALLLSAALAVGGIPEGFPLALTLALSSGVRRMAASNAIVKDMGSVETLGTTTVICTDKTGTLTQNKMMVVKASFNDESDIDYEGKPYEPGGEFKLKGKVVDKSELLGRKDFFYNCILCNNAEIEKTDSEWRLSGDPTEGALLGLAKAAEFDDVVVREENKRLLEIPFDSSRKYMISVNRVDDESVAYIKGAVEKVLDKCSYVFRHGRKVRLTKEERDKVLAKVDNYTGSALRVLALATKHLGDRKSKLEGELKDGFVFQGIVGIQDPVREEVYKSIEECRTAGIKPVIVTGDHKSTATAIGKKLNIVGDERKDLVVDGRELDDMTDDELDEKIGSIAIFSRTTPDHKFRIVEAFRRKNEVVAMTGDGVNDAPALKRAHIGVSMGKEGTDVAREASNIVLADDAFSTIVKAVREGRTIYSNIRRFTFYLLTVNVAEVSIILLAILFGLVNPLTALMILFINVITSSIPSMGLSVEPTNDKVMKYLPRSPDERLLSKYILLKIAVVVPLLVVSALALFLWELYLGMGDVDRARTLAFASIIVFELFHAFNARSLHTSIFKYRLFGNKYFYLSLLISLALMLLSIHTGWGNLLLGTVPLALNEWGIITLIGLMAIVSSEVIKLLVKAEFEEQSKLQGKKVELE